MSELTLFAHEDSTPLDFARLRAARRERLFEVMERGGLDALLLGRAANIRYATGARRLWIAGSLQFAPACVVTGAGGIHLVSTSDEGIPDEIPRENLIPASLNPQNIARALGEIEDLTGARRIGVDAMSETFAGLLPSIAPAAEVVDATSALQEARAVKLPGEVACLRTALSATEGALEETTDYLIPGISERELAARYAAAMTRYGLTQPALQGTFCVLPRQGDSLSTREGCPPLRRLPGDRPVEAGDPVAMHAGVIYAGYEGSIARTRICPDPRGATSTRFGDLQARCNGVIDSMIAACTAGNSGGDLRRAYEHSGEPLPPLPVAHGLGLGMETPIIGTNLGPAHDDSQPLIPGMVLALQAYVFTDAVGGWLEGTVVHITEKGPVRLTRLPS